jgi:hypothetical protein
MDTPQARAADTASWNLESRSTLTKTSSGSRDTDAKALAVIA